MTGPDGGASPDAQRRAVEQAMRHVAALIADGHQVTLTHGNGPQVGNLILKNQLAAHVVPPVPLDWCGAQTQATIGTLVLNALDGRAAVVVTRTLVDPADPAFQDPVKPIGRYFSEAEARRFEELGQTWRRFDRGWRRVVASPSRWRSSTPPRSPRWWRRGSRSWPREAAACPWPAMPGGGWAGSRP